MILKWKKNVEKATIAYSLVEGRTFMCSYMIVSWKLQEWKETMCCVHIELYQSNFTINKLNWIAHWIGNVVGFCTWCHVSKPFFLLFSKLICESLKESHWKNSHFNSYSLYAKLFLNKVSFEKLIKCQWMFKYFRNDI